MTIGNVLGGIWTGIEQGIDHSADTAKEALKSAGLDWRVIQRPLQTEKGFKIPDTVANFRADPDGDFGYLGTVGTGYQVLQNPEAQAFMESVVREGEATFHSAGILDGGRKVWILYKLNKEILIGARDLIQPFIMVMNSHDMSTSVMGMPVPYRPACANMIPGFIKSAGDSVVRIRHSGDLKSKLRNAASVMRKALRFYEHFEASANEMQATRLTSANVDAFLNALIPDPIVTETSNTRTENKREAILSNYKGGRGSELAGETLWGLVNAVGEYTDHTKWETSKASDLANKRAKAGLLGSGAALKEAAWGQAQELVLARR